MFENLSIIIPFRPKTEERRRIFEWVHKRTLDIPPGAEVIVSSDIRNDSNHFNKSMAINDGVIQAKNDIICMLDADVIIDVDIFKKAYEAMQQNSFVILFDRIRYLSKETSEMLLQTDCGLNYSELEKSMPKIVGQYPNGVGTALMFRRKKFIEMGGCDERLVGWGYEDNVFHGTYSALYGGPVVLNNYIYHIHHSHSANPQPADYDEQQYFNNEYQLILKNNPVANNKLVFEEYCKVRSNRETLLSYLKANLKSPLKHRICL